MEKCEVLIGLVSVLWYIVGDKYLLVLYAAGRYFITKDEILKGTQKRD